MDRLSTKLLHSYDLNDQGDVVRDVEDGENWNTVIEDTGEGPHVTELCQMCHFLMMAWVSSLTKMQPQEPNSE